MTLVLYYSFSDTVCAIERNCENGATPNSVDCACECPRGYSGKYCQSESLTTDMSAHTDHTHAVHHTDHTHCTPYRPRTLYTIQTTHTLYTIQTTHTVRHTDHTHCTPYRPHTHCTPYRPHTLYTIQTTHTLYTIHFSSTCSLQSVQCRNGSTCEMITCLWRRLWI